MSTCHIRAASPSDAAGIAIIHVAAWHAAYVGIVPQSHLDQLTVEDKTRLWETILGDPRKAANVLVATTAAKNISSVSIVEGFASYGPIANSDNCESGDSEKRGELRALYVDPEYWSQGTGRRLCLEVLEKLKDMECTVTDVWVLAENVRAVNFYHRLGFTRTAERMTEIEMKDLLTLRLSRSGPVV